MMRAGDYERDGASGLLLPRHARKGVERAHPQWMAGPGFFGGAAATDPYRSQRVILLHMDGVNGGTTFTDNAATPNTITPSNVTTSTAQARFGSTSALWASGGQLTAASTTALIPAGDYCVECWFWTSSQTAAAVRVAFIKSTSSGHRPYSIQINTDGTINGSMSNSAPSVSVNISSTGKVVANAWNHLAMTRSGSTVRLFLNGNLESTGTFSGSIYSNAAHSLWIGNTSDNLYPITGCYIDEFTLVNGAPVYTASFTPPTAPVPNS